MKALYFLCATVLTVTLYILAGCTSAPRSAVDTAAASVRPIIEPAPAPTPAKVNNYSLQALDTDGDKNVSLAEFHRAVHRKFTELDRNHSGKIELGTEAQSFEDWCLKVDLNRDEIVTEDEFNARAEKDFRKADRNRNGRLDEKELNTLVLFRL